MLTINIPAELEAKLVEIAKLKGATPEALAVESLRKLYEPTLSGAATSELTLAQSLAGYVGTIDGDPSAWSEHTGDAFGDLLHGPRSSD